MENMNQKPKTIYRILFNSQGKGYEIYARSVTQAEMYGFIAIEGVLFGEKSSLLLDPSEESLKNEFQDVKRLLIPFHQIARIDEVAKEGRGKVVSLSTPQEPAVTPPMPPAPHKGKSP